MIKDQTKKTHLQITEKMTKVDDGRPEKDEDGNI